MQVTLRDIAQKTGYSITTVSRALAGYDDVNQETRQRIIAAASQLGYQPNLVARQLRSQRTQTLGLIIQANDRHSFSNDFFSQLILGIGDSASNEGYSLLISAQSPGDAEMAAYRDMVGGQRVDGMIVARTREHDPRISYLKTQRIPFVVNGRGTPNEDSDFAYIDADNREGIRRVTEHFIALGHRHIGLILPPEGIVSGYYRYEGYRDALLQHDLPYRAEYVVRGDLLRTGGYAAANHLLDHFPQITAIVACNDLMAIGAMSALQQRGIAVGNSIAVSGFDDIPAAEYASPGLTTVHQPIYEIGQGLVRMLIGLIDGEEEQQTHVILPTTLVIRESSGKTLK
ncbi:MAG: LacI family DNA-binding transcriptional regulator [Anaerolineae bacterium]|nr:LacI family DNA-binding transcriptional regulator [Anaerolineae bacterium]